jgi:hypothetical protein
VISLNHRRAPHDCFASRGLGIQWFNDAVKFHRSCVSLVDSEISVDDSLVHPSPQQPQRTLKFNTLTSVNNNWNKQLLQGISVIARSSDRKALELDGDADGLLGAENVVEFLVVDGERVLTVLVGSTLADELEGLQVLGKFESWNLSDFD